MAAARRERHWRRRGGAWCLVDTAGWVSEAGPFGPWRNDAPSIVAGCELYQWAGPTRVGVRVFISRAVILWGLACF